MAKEMIRVNSRKEFKFNNQHPSWSTKRRKGGEQSSHIRHLIINTEPL